MAKYKISEKGGRDLDEIYEYSIKNFGIERAREYFNELHKSFSILQASPYLGVAVKGINKKIFKYVHIKHMIYYQVIDENIIISRVANSKQNQVKILLNS